MSAPYQAKAPTFDLRWNAFCSKCRQNGTAIAANHCGRDGGVGRGRRVGRGLGVILGVAVGVTLGDGLIVGVDVAVGVGVTDGVTVGVGVPPGTVKAYTLLSPAT